MSDQYSVTPLFVHTWSRYSALWNNIADAALTAASITCPVADSAWYIPMAIPWPYPVKRVFWINGSSVTTTTMDFGIFTWGGTNIYSTGNTTAVNASATQYVTPSPLFILSPGMYYFALGDSSSTANRGGHGSTGIGLQNHKMIGMLQQATARPLPATMTGVTVANAYYPICGVTRTASGF